MKSELEKSVALIQRSTEIERQRVVGFLRERAADFRGSGMESLYARHKALALEDAARFIENGGHVARWEHDRETGRSHP